MRLTCLLAVSLICTLCILQVSGVCMCGALSEDYCTCNQFRPSPRFIIKPQSLMATTHSTGDCQCRNHIIEPIFIQEPAYAKKIPINIVYTTPLCSSCAAFGRPLCSNCVLNCKPLCNKCALIGKPSCHTCLASVASMELPAIKTFSFPIQETKIIESSSFIPEKSTEQIPKSTKKISISKEKFNLTSGNNKNVIEVNENKLNLNPQLLGIKKFFSYDSWNDKKSINLENQKQLKKNEVDIKNKQNIQKEHENEENDNSDENNINNNSSNSSSSSSSEEELKSIKPQIIYITYSSEGFGHLPNKITRIISISNKSKNKTPNISLNEQDFKVKNIKYDDGLLELFKY